MRLIGLAVAAPRLGAIFQGLRELGYVDGRNYSRWAHAGRSGGTLGGRAFRRAKRAPLHRARDIRAFTK
jgi:hypothetical protein